MQVPSFHFPSRGEEKAIDARNLFEYHCAKCHGLTGEANKRGKALKAPDLCDPGWQNSKTDERNSSFHH
ncbi:c-type cytochrome [Candidatus Kuenenia stuttgartiensis]|uniref:c-type cytochrome n=1 Tax=Kuenenia stuttgartiensis TaxID=174633 RepID=UPI000C08211A|nr:c-type cytochrome [Candidatus Kuenenia stuttgartiensis]